MRNFPTAKKDLHGKTVQVFFIFGVSFGILP